MFGSKRRRAPTQPLTSATANPFATTAAASAFARRESSTPNLSQAAAAAALKARPQPTTDVSAVVSKRSMRRNGSVSSSHGSVSPRPLHRSTSSGSMTQRTFRSPSPHGRQSPSGGFDGFRDELPPPMPAIPDTIDPPTREQQEQLKARPTSLGIKTTPIRVGSQKLKEGKGTWFGTAAVGDAANVRTSDAIMSTAGGGALPRSSEPAKRESWNSVTSNPTRPDSRSSANFSYPSRFRLGSPPSSPLPEDPPSLAPPDTEPGLQQRESQLEARTKSPPRHTRSESAPQQNSQASSKPQSPPRKPKRTRSTRSPPEAGAEVASRPRQGPTAGAVDQDLVYDPNSRRLVPRQSLSAVAEVPHESAPEPRPSQAPTRPRPSHKSNITHHYVDGADQRNEEDGEASKQGARPGNGDMRSPERRSNEPRLPVVVESPPARPTVSLPTGPVGEQAAPESALYGATRHSAANIANILREEYFPGSTTGATRTLPSGDDSSAWDDKNLKGERSHSSSPARTHFDTRPSTLMVKHSPPPRSVSPRKSALKNHHHQNQQQSPPRSESSVTADEASEASVGPEGLTAGSAPRRKNVRVSFDERTRGAAGADEVAESPSTAAAVAFLESPESSSPPQPPASSSARTSSPPASTSSPMRRWYETWGARRRNAAPTSSTISDEDEDDDITMKPRPALPSFGSIREQHKPPRDADDERPLVTPGSKPYAIPPSPPESPQLQQSQPHLQPQASDASGPSVAAVTAEPASTDRAIGGILTRDHVSRVPANTSRFREPLPPVVTSKDPSSMHMSSSSSDSDSDQELLADTPLIGAESSPRREQSPPPLPAAQPVAAPQSKPNQEPLGITGTEFRTNTPPPQIPTIAVSSPSPRLQSDEKMLAAPIAPAPIAPEVKDVKEVEVPESAKDPALEQLFLPGGFPDDESDGSVLTIKEAAPAQGASPIVSPQTASLSPAARNDPSETESDGESIYVDASEDPDDMDGQQYQSLNAIVEAPVAPALPNTAVAPLPSQSRTEGASATADPSHGVYATSAPNAVTSAPIQPQAPAPVPAPATGFTFFPDQPQQPQRPPPPPPQPQLPQDKSVDEWEVAKAFWRGLSAEKRAQLEKEALDDAGDEADVDESKKQAAPPRRKKSDNKMRASAPPAPVQRRPETSAGESGQGFTSLRKTMRGPPPASSDQEGRGSAEGGRRFSLRSFSPSGSFRRAGPTSPGPASPTASPRLRTSLRDSHPGQARPSTAGGSSSGSGRKGGGIHLPSFGRKSKAASGGRKGGWSSRLADSSSDEETGGRPFLSRFDGSSDEETEVLPPLASSQPKRMSMSLRAAGSAGGDGVHKRSGSAVQSPPTALPDVQDKKGTPVLTASPRARLTRTHSSSDAAPKPEGDSSPRTTQHQQRGSSSRLMSTILGRRRSAATTESGGGGRILRRGGGGGDALDSAARRDTPLERSPQQLAALGGRFQRRSSSSSLSSLGPDSPAPEAADVDAKGKEKDVSDVVFDSSLPVYTAAVTAGGAAAAGDYAHSPTRAMSEIGAPSATTPPRPDFAHRRTLSLGAGAMLGSAASGGMGVGVVPGSVESTPRKKKFSTLRRMFRLDD